LCAERRKTHFVIANVPHRHDLMPSSCVNSEVVKFNRQLTKNKKICYVKILEVNLDTECFTKCDQHLNLTWKEHISCCCH
jgi:hypothetical protein